MQDFFALLELEKSFSIDEAALQRAYISKQREYHPDRQAGKTATERQKAALFSIDVNSAYHTLKNPVSRAQHLLSLEGVNVNSEKDTYKPDMSLLMETMEMRETLENAQQPDEFDHLRENAEKRFEESSHTFSKAYENGDLNTASSAAMRMRYLEKFLDEVRIHRSQKLKAAVKA